MIGTTRQQSFQDWMKEVDAWVYRHAGLSASDLPDCCYADWHADGMTPKTAARKAIRSAREEGY